MNINHILYLPVTLSTVQSIVSDLSLISISSNHFMYYLIEISLSSPKCFMSNPINRKAPSSTFDTSNAFLTHFIIILIISGFPASQQNELRLFLQIFCFYHVCSKILHFLLGSISQCWQRIPSPLTITCMKNHWGQTEAFSISRVFHPYIHPLAVPGIYLGLNIYPGGMLPLYLYSSGQISGSQQ